MIARKAVKAGVGEETGGVIEELAGGDLVGVDVFDAGAFTGARCY